MTNEEHEDQIKELEMTSVKEEEERREHHRQHQRAYRERSKQKRIEEYAQSIGNQQKNLRK